MLYGLDVSGSLCCSPLARGAGRQAIAALEPEAAFNGAALAPVLRLGAAFPEVTFVGVSRASVQAVTVATGEVRTVYKPRAGRTLAANEAGAASGFGGVVATLSACGVAERLDNGRIALVMQSFSPGQPSEQAFVLEGEAAAGPTVHDRVLALCTREQIGVFDTVSGTAVTMALPRGFQPYMARRQGAMVLAPGTIPLLGARWPEGLCAVVAGEQGGVTGILTVRFAGQTSRFEPMGEGSSLTASQDGTLVIAEGEELRVAGAGGWQTLRAPGLRSEMPVSFAAPFAFSFAGALTPGEHRLAVRTAERGRMTELTFTDPQCRPHYCCAPVLSGNDLAVPYFDTGADGEPALKLAHWAL